MRLSGRIFILKGDKTPTSIGSELQQFSLGGSLISFQDKASGGLQRCADVLCHAKHDAHLAARMPLAFLNSCRFVIDIVIVQKKVGEQ